MFVNSSPDTQERTWLEDVGVEGQYLRDPHEKTSPSSVQESDKLLLVTKSRGDYPIELLGSSVSIRPTRILSNNRTNYSRVGGELKTNMTLLKDVSNLAREVQFAEFVKPGSLKTPMHNYTPSAILK
jgi:hypothetical protein